MTSENTHESSVELLPATFQTPLVHVPQFLEAFLHAVDNLSEHRWNGSVHPNSFNKISQRFAETEVNIR
jgi:hypothetical protein